MKKQFIFISTVLIMVMLSACSSRIDTSTDPTAGPQDQRDRSDEVESTSRNQAVVGLLEQGQNHANYGEYALAKSKLERALRIEPQNPFIWYALAQVNFAEDQYAEARNLAQRALSFSSGYETLRRNIQSFIQKLP